MIRLILYFALIFGLGTALALFADQPGSLTISWLGTEIQTTVFIAAIALILAFGLLVLAIWLGAITLSAPKRFAARLARRKVRIGQEAVRRGIFAAGAGDAAAALRASTVAKKNVPEEPLSLLLEAQAAQLNEDAIGSRQAFERMLERPDMAELGLRGLYLEAKKTGQMEAARQFAERALAANPALSWSSSALFDMQCREGDWRGALRTLGIAKQQRHLPKAEAERRRAILLTALAAEIEDTQPSKALAYALEAVGLQPRLTQAAVIAGRVLAAQGSISRATKVVAQAWRQAPHPDLALVYAHARTGDSPGDRLSRVKSLVASSAPSIEGDIAVAVAAIEAKDWAAARSAIEPHANNAPSARICKLMARIEAGQNRDAGRAREWLARAARAAPDPMWVAPDGTTSKEWLPMSAATGALGVFEWKTSPRAEAPAEELIAEIRDLELQAVVQESAPPTIDTAVEERAMPQGEAQERSELKRREEKARYDDGKLVDAAPQREPMPEPTPPTQMSADFTAIKPANAPTILPRRKPQIFIPGPAPDDPGPRSGEQEDSGTPVSRYRNPI